MYQHKLPESALSIWSYSSQSCADTFRLTRSMLGAISSVVNFTTDKFLKRAGTFFVSTDLENQSEYGQLKCPLQFSRHHKRRRKATDSKKSVYNIPVNLPIHDISKKTIHRAFDDAYNLLCELDINFTLEKRNNTMIHEVSPLVRTQLAK